MVQVQILESDFKSLKLNDFFSVKNLNPNSTYIPLKIPQKPHFLVTKSWFERPPSSWLLVTTPQTSFEIYLSQLVVGYPATMG